ncbi:hypothetical protein [uncultured Acinetobacter sp.]|uniref:hypothetical protein n=1 Tax=uncultured Acinetobacter sp. TaxID=165433 RepID=UPI002587238C|nr:hypothetical protein [uncultured Acinetobacter sp.]
MNDNQKLWAVNIPEEPDSSPILHAVPTLEIGEQIVSRLKQEATQVFKTCVGEAIADAITLEKWEGSHEEHAKYLSENGDWWNHTTFLEQ